MAYPVRSRPSVRTVTTNVEKSAEAEVADFGQIMAKGRMVCNINRRCMFRFDNGRNVHVATTIEIGIISRQQKS